MKKSTLKRVAPNRLATGKRVALGFPIDLEFEVSVVEGGKPEKPGEKSLEQGREPTTNSPNK